MRGVSILVILVAAGCETSAELELDWANVDLPEADGVDLELASGSGERIWAAGASTTSGVVVQLDGTSGTVILDEPDLVPTRLAAVGPDDLWMIAGGLHHWNGDTWTIVDLGTEAGTSALEPVAVWGSAPDDVWVSVLRDSAGALPALFHHDGEIWTEQVGLSLLEDDALGEGFRYLDGCSDGRDRAWVVAGYPESAYANVYQWDGETWSRATNIFEQTRGAIDGVACDGGLLWLYGEVADLVGINTGPFVIRYDGTAWAKADPPAADDSSQLEGLAASGSDAWALGAVHSPANGRSTPAIWRYVDRDSHQTRVGDLGRGELTPLESELSPILRTIWTTSSGRTVAFGIDGLVLESRLE